VLPGEPTAAAESIVELGDAVPERTALKRGILTLAESVQCIGGQLGQIGDRSGTLLAALLLDHLQIHYPDMFHDSVRWQSRMPGQLGHIVCSSLNQVMPTDQTIQYYYQGLEAIEAILANDPLVKRYLTAFEAAQHSVLVLRFSICERKPQYKLNHACPDASCLRNCPIAGIALGRLEIEREVGVCAAAKNIGTLSASQDIIAGTAAKHVGAALAAQHVVAA
jgi:hypothetical protein